MLLVMPACFLHFRPRTSAVAPLAALRMVTPSPRIRKRWGEGAKGRRGEGAKGRRGEGAKVKHLLSRLDHVTMRCFKTTIHQNTDTLALTIATHRDVLEKSCLPPLPPTLFGRVYVDWKDVTVTDWQLYS